MGSLSIFKFFQSEDHVLIIVLFAQYTSGWVGMRFSKTGFMVNSSTMYCLRGTKLSQVKPDEGELNVTHSPIVVLYGATIYLAFQLKFSDRLHRENILLAFGNKTPLHARLSEHDDKTSITFNFSAGLFLTMMLPFRPPHPTPPHPVKHIANKKTKEAGSQT
ncbi:hypothetical protein NE237_027097 [Protea cynaroides]|uniref:Uncharacterized protein n=1 Tax=Protea cynaroides TaxID=273540 RepID=A0A9Q0GMR2_9MAGN|nr:hypothetical protein NE237_027097 [Protea cynaroides]